MKGMKMFAKTFIDEPQAFWDNVMIMFYEQMKPKQSSFLNAVHQFLYRRSNEAHEEKKTLPTVKHSGGYITLQGCFAASGTSSTECIKGMTESKDYQGILERNVSPCV